MSVILILIKPTKIHQVLAFLFSLLYNQVMVYVFSIPVKITGGIAEITVYRRKMAAVSVNLEYINGLISDNNIDMVVKICYGSNKENYKYITDYLLELINKTNNPLIINTIALIFMDLKFDNAVPIIVSLINNPKNKGVTGTLIYALEDLNCANDIKKIIHILFDGSYESKFNLYLLLKKKVRDMNNDDIEFCLNTIQNSKMELCEDSDLIMDVKSVLEYNSNNRLLKL